MVPGYCQCHSIAYHQRLLLFRVFLIEGLGPVLSQISTQIRITMVIVITHQVLKYINVRNGRDWYAVGAVGHLNNKKGLVLVEVSWKSVPLLEQSKKNTFRGNNGK